MEAECEGEEADQRVVAGRGSDGDTDLSSWHTALSRASSETPTEIKFGAAERHRVIEPSCKEIG